MDFKGFVTGAAALTLVAAMPLSAHAGSQIRFLTVSGTGKTVTTNNDSKSKCYAAGLVCNKGDKCQCVEETGSTVGSGDEDHGKILDNATFDDLFSVDLTEKINAGNSHECFPAAGLMTFTSGGDSIQALANGLACNAGTITTPQGVISGGYTLANGTGGFQGVRGVGTFTSAGLPALGDTLLQWSGNIVSNN